MSDSIKVDPKFAVQQLMTLEPGAHILTGDNKQTTAIIAKETGIYDLMNAVNNIRILIAMNLSLLYPTK